MLRIILAQFGTLLLDQNTFIAWAHSLTTNGFSMFYTSWSDYLPGYLYVLSFLSRIESIGIPTVVLYKLPAITADIFAGLTTYYILKKKYPDKALFGAVLVWFNPATIANSTLWGQVDILTVLFSLASVVSFESSVILSAIFLSIGSAIKPQAALTGLVLLPLFLQKSFKQKIVFVLVATGVLLLLFFPFSNGQNIVSFIFERLGVTLNQYPYGSVNAFNFWGLFGFWKPEGASLFTNKYLGYLLFGLVSLVGYIQFRKQNGDRQLSSIKMLALLFLANFLFFTRMHERHLLPAIVALAPLAAISTELLISYVVLSFVYIANMNYAFIWITENFKESYSPLLIFFFILLNIVSLVIVLQEEKTKSFIGFIRASRVGGLVGYVKGFLSSPEPKVFAKDISNKTAKILLVVILVWALSTRLFALVSPEHEYFDEVYHAFTAREMLHGNIKVWEWWNESPEGFAYEWTHPPFAKLAMVMSMVLVGETSFGWRLPAALFGTGSVYLVYVLTKELFKKEKVALLAAFLFSLDGLALVLSRIGMNDIYLVFFLLLTIILFLKNKIVFSSIALGLAASAKWTTLWLLPILVVTFILKQKRIKISYLSFLIIPVAIYVCSYLFMFTSGHTFDIFWGMQKQMWWYHTGLVATHPFSSPWWSWPVLGRPIWLYTSGEHNGVISNIYAMGNPIIFWGGLASIFLTSWYALKDKSKSAAFVVASYAGLFMPWAFSPRIMFLYHYFPAVPFLCISLAYCLSRLPKLILPFLIIAGVVFLYFFPRLTGLPVPVWLNESYYWLPSWR